MVYLGESVDHARDFFAYCNERKKKANVTLNTIDEISNEPLDKLMQQTATPGNPGGGVPDLAPATGSNSANSRLPLSEGRARDADRSRARELR